MTDTMIRSRAPKQPTTIDECDQRLAGYLADWQHWTDSDRHRMKRAWWGCVDRVLEARWELLHPGKVCGA